MLPSVWPRHKSLLNATTQFLLLLTMHTSEGLTWSEPGVRTPLRIQQVWTRRFGSSYKARWVKTGVEHSYRRLHRRDVKASSKHEVKRAKDNSIHLLAVTNILPSEKRNTDLHRASSHTAPRMWQYLRTEDVTFEENLRWRLYVQAARKSHLRGIFPRYACYVMYGAYERERPLINKSEALRLWRHSQAQNGGLLRGTRCTNGVLRSLSLINTPVKATQRYLKDDVIYLKQRNYHRSAKTYFQVGNIACLCLDGSKGLSSLPLCT